MKYINDTNNAEIKTYRQLQNDNLGASLPKDGTNIILAVWFVIHNTAKQAYNTDTHKLVEGAPAKTGNEYNQTWLEVALDQPTMDANLATAKSNKYEQIWTEADKRNIEAEATLIGSSTSNHPTRNNDRIIKKNSRIANKKIKGQTPNQGEEDFVDAYDELMDWQDSTYDVAESDGVDAVENMTTPSAVNAFDVVNDVTWQSDFVLP